MKRTVPKMKAATPASTNTDFRRLESLARSAKVSAETQEADIPAPTHIERPPANDEASSTRPSKNAKNKVVVANVWLERKAKSTLDSLAERLHVDRDYVLRAAIEGVMKEKDWLKIGKTSSILDEARQLLSSKPNKAAVTKSMRLHQNSLDDLSSLLDPLSAYPISRLVGVVLSVRVEKEIERLAKKL